MSGALDSGVRASPAGRRRGRWGWLGLLLLCAPSPTFAGEALLSVRHGEREVSFDQRRIERLPWRRVDTSTAWTEGVRRFEGPLLRDVLEQAGFAPEAGARITLVAWNDYEISVAADDFYRWDVILARSMDGAPLTLDDHGPLWVVYPRDDFAELQDSRFDHRWVWMLRRLEVEP